MLPQRLIDKIKKGELAEEPNLEKKTWEEIQEMTRNGNYTGQLSALVNKKYEKHTMSIKDWLLLHDGMISSHRHLRKVNESTKEYQTERTNKNKIQTDLTTIKKNKQHTQTGKGNVQLRHKIKKMIGRDLNNKK